MACSSHWLQVFTGMKTHRAQRRMQSSRGAADLGRLRFSFRWRGRLFAGIYCKGSKLKKCPSEALLTQQAQNKQPCRRRQRNEQQPGEDCSVFIKRSMHLRTQNTHPLFSCWLKTTNLKWQQTKNTTVTKCNAKAKEREKIRNKTTKTRWKKHQHMSWKWHTNQNVTQTSAKRSKTAKSSNTSVYCVSLNSITSILSVSIVSKIKRKHDQTGAELL